MYKKALAVICTSSIISLGLFIYFLTFENKILTAVTMFLYGFSTTPILPVTIDFACEVVYPIGEALTTGVVISAG